MCVYLCILAILKIAPAGVVDRLVGFTVGVHVHCADGGREHDALDAGVCRRRHHILCAPDCWLDHHLLQHMHTRVLHWSGRIGAKYIIYMCPSSSLRTGSSVTGEAAWKTPSQPEKASTRLSGSSRSARRRTRRSAAPSRALRWSFFGSTDREFVVYKRTKGQYYACIVSFCITYMQIKQIC